MESQRNVGWGRVLILLIVLGVELAMVAGVIWFVFAYVLAPPDFSAFWRDLVALKNGLLAEYHKFLALPEEIRIPIILGAISSLLFEAATFLYVRRRVREGYRGRALLRLSFYMLLGLAGVAAALLVPYAPPVAVFMLTCGTIVFQCSLVMLLFECRNALMEWLGLTKKRSAGP